MYIDELDINQRIIDRALKLGIEELTPIQEGCIIDILAGEDVVGQAETGSGKTLAFVLPILNDVVPGKGVQVLVLTPTRELCVQVKDVFSDFAKDLRINTLSIYGGVSIGAQIKRLTDADVVVGTPGRILDHIGRKTIDLSTVKFLVLDETDKMFDMGFVDDVERIIKHVPEKRRTLMFSATISDDVQKVMERHLNNPVIIKTQSYVDKSLLKQTFYDIHEQRDKFSLLVHLLKENTNGLAIVFCATRDESDVVARNLKNQGIRAAAIHGGMSQDKRMKSLDSLKRQRIDVLVATDVAARGLDIKNVTHVYNYDVPKTSKEYVHRIGRTARAGEDGDAITLLTPRDHDNFRRVRQDKELNIEEAKMPDFEKVPFEGDYRRRSYGGGGRTSHSRRPQGGRHISASHGSRRGSPYIRDGNRSRSRSPRTGNSRPDSRRGSIYR